MGIKNLYFLLLLFGMIICLICVFISINSVISVLSLIGYFLNGVGVLFFLKSEYIGAVYLIVYVGALAVLFLFVVMMLDFRSGLDLFYYKTEYFFISFFYIVVFYIYLSFFLFKFLNVIDFFDDSDLMNNDGYYYKFWVSFYESQTDIFTVGILLYNENYLSFFLCGFLLFAAMYGAVLLTLYKREGIRVQNLSDQILRSPNKLVLFYKKK